MSKYKVVNLFTDLQDNGYAYHVGDTFPHDGMIVSEKRLSELSSTKNRRGIVLIEKIAESDSVESADMSSENTEEGAKKPVKRSGKKEKVNKDAE